VEVVEPFDSVTIGHVTEASVVVQSVLPLAAEPITGDTVEPEAVELVGPVTVELFGPLTVESV